MCPKSFRVEQGIGPSVIPSGIPCPVHGVARWAEEERECGVSMAPETGASSGGTICSSWATRGCLATDDLG